MAYATLNEFKGYVGIPTADTADDVTLQLALDAATGQVEGFCDRLFTADGSVVTRYYNAWSAHTATQRRYGMVGASYVGFVDVDPISTTTGLVVATDQDADGTYETTWTLNTDFRLEPVNAAVLTPVQPWTRLVALGTKWFPKGLYRPAVSVTAKFGWPGGVVPAQVKEATLIQAERLWKRKDAPFGVAGSVEFGSEMRLLNELDRDAQNLLRPFRRSWWVA